MATAGSDALAVCSWGVDDPEVTTGSIGGGFEASPGSPALLVLAAAHQEPLVLPTRQEVDSSRYERLSMIVSSNKSFSAWAEIFGDPVAVAAMVDRLVHHAEVIVLKGESYRLKGKSKEVMGSESS